MTVRVEKVGSDLRNDIFVSCTSDIPPPKSRATVCVQWSMSLNPHGDRSMAVILV